MKKYYCYLKKGKVVAYDEKPKDFDHKKTDHRTYRVPTAAIAKKNYESDLRISNWRNSNLQQKAPKIKAHTLILFVSLFIFTGLQSVLILNVYRELAEQMHNQTQYIEMSHRCSLGYQESCEEIKSKMIASNTSP